MLSVTASLASGQQKLLEPFALEIEQAFHLKLCRSFYLFMCEAKRPQETTRLIRVCVFISAKSSVSLFKLVPKCNDRWKMIQNWGILRSIWVAKWSSSCFFLQLIVTHDLKQWFFSFSSKWAVKPTVEIPIHLFKVRKRVTSQRSHKLMSMLYGNALNFFQAFDKRAFSI